MRVTNIYFLKNIRSGMYHIHSAVFGGEALFRRWFTLCLFQISQLYAWLMYDALQHTLLPTALYKMGHTSF
jgi:hypothetical protein